MRTIAIGDIHGCATALDRLIEEIRPTESDRLIFLGDYVDRGPDSRGVIDRLLALRRRCGTFFLLGNHEIIFRNVLGGLPAEAWLGVGGQETLASYGGSLENVPPSHWEFLYSLIPYYETEKAMFVHANYDPALPLAKQPELTLFWEHLGEKLPAAHCSGKHVFLGHTPQTNFEIGYFGHFTCIDTYCFGGGWLTGLDVSSGKVWQVSQAGKIRRKRRFWRLLKEKFDAPES